MAKKNAIPKIEWRSQFPDGELDSIATDTLILLIAFDTESQSNDTANTNVCLSFQFSAIDLHSGTYKTGIFYADINAQERFTLSELTRKILDEMDISIKSLQGYHIIYIAHFFAAEWAMLADRKELYMKFEFIRKSMITTRPLETTMKTDEGETVTFWMDFKDTMLLLPEGYKSLEKASTFIKGFEKLTLEAHYKSNMLQLLHDDPKRFEAYAIRDAEVTLRLFIKLQYLLNQINGTTNKIFSTLASATTQDFSSFSKEKHGKDVHKMQFDRKHTIYKEYESLATRGYMGGLNSSYHIGTCEGYTFIDIDFKNAYPTAMNLLQVGDFGEAAVKRSKKKHSREIESETLL